ncbi:type I DNA topoisomerase [Kineococcus sp. SYSU DK005]|uniref:type I DNA topoisomerase n=1 Tax=Kineococcus sp. SYSU DK005 TaxID=3383126 RepID=UPI003D7D92F0
MAGKSKAAGTGDGLRRLVIVESASKIDKIAGYLGPGYRVEASAGHIRDLPQPSQLPEEVKKGSFGKFAVDVDHGFEPYYVVDADKKRTVAELKRALKDSDELILATDRDREGEAIAWHLVQALEPRVPYRRMVFGEITREAIQQAVREMRDIDDRLVDAQETRRILDRLYGYELSPVLWRKVRAGLSAGRVQSVATRLCVERERERMAFRAAGYADVTGQFSPQGESAFGARLVALDGRRVATGRDFDDSGQLKPTAVRDGVAHLDLPAAEALARSLDGAAFAVRSVEEKPYSRRPAAPFITSSLQQEASRKLRLNARATMRTAQSLYERGYITYMRTDSIQLSAQAVNAARSQARELYGPEYVPDSPRVYASKSKNAQEAHEAIRPAGEVFRTPAQVSGELRGDEFRLYDLIWKRTVASQMHDARGTTATVRLGAASADGRDAEFSASGTIITFRGFLAAYEEGRDETREGADADSTDRRLPQVRVGQPLSARDLAADGHVTSPPPRYTEATLVKTLEEKGIGRPSTFASIISTIVDRGYVRYKGSALVPTWLAFAVTRLLEEHFPTLVDYDFTASMENDLDAISRGEAERVDWLTRFYFGADGPAGGAPAPAAGGSGDGSAGPAVPAMEGIKGLADDLGKIDAREISTVPIGEGIVLRVGRYGPYLEGPDPETGELLKASVPEDVAPDEMTVETARELLTTQSDGDRVLGQDPTTGRTVVARTGRYGPYVTELLEEDAPAPAEAAEGAPKKRTAKKAAKAKPRTSSLFKDMSVETVTLEQALQLLSLPRVVGTDPESGEEITAQNGRYGPYLKKGTDSRSLASEDQLLTITLPEALGIYAQPKTRRGQVAKPPLKELGPDPESGQPMVVKDGRFGPYVTDGTTNATLRKDDDPETITPERGAELLAEKRAKGPAPKKAAARKTAAKTAPAKKTAAKKTAAKKAAAKASAAAVD